MSINHLCAHSPSLSSKRVRQALLQYVGQAVKMLVASATDATAQGVAATGIEVGLPEEVRLRVSGRDVRLRSWLRTCWGDPALSQSLSSRL